MLKNSSEPVAISGATGKQSGRLPSCALQQNRGSIVVSSTDISRTFIFRVFRPGGRLVTKKQSAAGTAITTVGTKGVYLLSVDFNDSAGVTVTTRIVIR